MAGGHRRVLSPTMATCWASAGMWFKMSFFEGSARVPLMISEPGMVKDGWSRTGLQSRCHANAGDLAGVSMDEVAPWTDGESLRAGHGGSRTMPVLMEYAAEGSDAPLVAIRDGQVQVHPLRTRPRRSCSISKPIRTSSTISPMILLRRPGWQPTWPRSGRWDMARFDAEVRESQARRWVVYEALRNGNYYPWDFQPLQKASERYMRNHMDLNILEESQRFPRGD
jgi:choline-sulfatase